MSSSRVSFILGEYKWEGLLRVCCGDQQLCELKAVLTTSSKITSVLGSVEVRYNVGGLDQRKLDTRLIVPPINPATSGATTPPHTPRLLICTLVQQRLDICVSDSHKD